MRRRPIAKWPETAQQRELLRPEPGDIDKGLGPGQHCEQRQHKHLVERIHHLAALARVRQIVKIAQKNTCFSKGSTIRRRLVHPCNPPSNLDGYRRIQSLTALSRTPSPDCPACVQVYKLWDMVLHRCVERRERRKARKRRRCNLGPLGKLREAAPVHALRPKWREIAVKAKNGLVSKPLDFPGGQ